jgi:hypothetical protein
MAVWFFFANTFPKCASTQQPAQFFLQISLLRDGMVLLAIKKINFIH